MSTITMSEITEIADPKLRAIAKRVFLTVRLAGEKAVAHYSDSAKYPLSNAASLERLFLSRFKEGVPSKKQTAVAKVMNDSVNAAQAVRVGTFGDLANVNLRAATAVQAQVKALAFPAALKFPLSHLTALTNLHGHLLPNGGGALIPQQTLDKLELRIHKVKCIDETNAIGLFTHEAGEDTIDLGGATVDEDGDTHEVNTFRVGRFEDGDTKSYSPPKRFCYFSLLAGNQWPKTFFATLVLAEVDDGGFAEFLNKLVDLIKDEVESALKAAVQGGLAGAGLGSFAGPIGAAIGACIGVVIGLIVDWMKSWLGDDIFKPITVSVRLGGLNARFPGNKTDSAEYVVARSGHGGRYQITYDWRLCA